MVASNFTDYKKQRWDYCCGGKVWFNEDRLMLQEQTLALFLQGHGKLNVFPWDGVAGIGSGGKEVAPTLEDGGQEL